MQQLTVPADVWACRQPGVPLVAAIVEGEPGCDGSYGCPARVHALGCSLSTAKSLDDGNLTRPQPPAWLVALRDARCYCWDGREIAPGDGMRDCTNPRCHDGRLLHDVRVECRDLDGVNDWHCRRHDPCCYCGNPPTVRCLVGVVPVVGWHNCTDDTAHVCVGNEGWTASGVIFHTVLTRSLPNETEHTLRPAHVDALAAACGKPPADWVGGYAVILTEVGE